GNDTEQAEVREDRHLGDDDRDDERAEPRGAVHPPGFVDVVCPDTVVVVWPATVVVVTTVVDVVDVVVVANTGPGVPADHNNTVRCCSAPRCTYGVIVALI